MRLNVVYVCSNVGRAFISWYAEVTFLTSFSLLEVITSPFFDSFICMMPFLNVFKIIRQMPRYNRHFHNAQVNVSNSKFIIYLILDYRRQSS
jgi:hypothetical protein